LSFLLHIGPPPSSTLFPYTTLFRSLPEISLNASTAKFARNNPAGTPNCGQDATNPRCALLLVHSIDSSTEPPHSPPTPTPWPQLDRKSTRLNSSHSQISYAVFCLKK